MNVLDAEKGVKTSDKRMRGKLLLETLTGKYLQEAIDFMEFLVEKGESDKPMAVILDEMHSEAHEKGLPEMTAEEAAELVHRVRRKKTVE